MDSKTGDDRNSGSRIGYAGLGVVCAVCREELTEGDTLAENRVEKCGELQYIELMHKECDDASKD